MTDIRGLGAVRGEDGRVRCPWAGSTPKYQASGPTTAYAAMQSLGLVNDHLKGCQARTACERERRQITP